MIGGRRMLQLVTPSMVYDNQIMGYKQAFIEAGDSLDGTSGLVNYSEVGEWLAFIQACQKPETLPQELVLADTYLAVRESDNKVVGMVNLRYELNDYLLAFGGHIGYSVLPEERQQGYAKEILALSLKKYADLAINRVLVTCDQKNAASKKTIMANGGVLENEVEADGRITQRYWIELSGKRTK